MDVPPSYEAAIQRDYWTIIARYVQSSDDLCSASRVCKKWHRIYAPLLWGNPAAHFGNENDRVYVALTRFKRSLKRVRASVRGFTHTLHLPPAQAEIYDGPHPEWLRDVLVELPNLQSLVVSQLPFFDHASLVSLQSYGKDTSLADNVRSSFTLRLLIANQCTNTTPRSLADGLIAFPHLVFLDLSRTLGARDAGVLTKLRYMESLQVLKLCGIQLRDDDIEILAEAIGIRLRSLDVRNNFLTDHSLRTLLHCCFLIPVDASAENGTRPNGLSGAADDDWSLGMLKPDPAVLDGFRDESFDERYLRRLTRGLVSRMPTEDQPYSGITHLYIANNRLTIEGVASLIKSTRLHVLDVGAVDTAGHAHRSSPGFPPSILKGNGRCLHLPGAEMLSPILAKYARNNLTSLRIDHGLVTRCTSFKEEERETGIRELDAGTHHRELDVAPPIYEPLDHQEDRFKLPGDSLHFLDSPAVGIKPEDAEPLLPPQTRRISIDSPKVVVEDHNETAKDVPVLTATAREPISYPSKALRSLSREHAASGLDQVGAPSPASPYLTGSSMTKQQEYVHPSQESGPHGLLPSMLPHLRSLTLTDVPCYDHSGEVVNALVQFIRQCASEVELAKLQICMHTKDSDPFRSSYKDRKPVRQAMGDMFALQKLTLEMSPPNGPTNPYSGARWTSPTSASRTKSSTEDPDSEAFWAAQEGDFSFFDDNEECGLPSVEAGPHLSMSTLSEKILSPRDSTSSLTLPTLQRPISSGPGQDVVQELVKFRKDRKVAYEIAQRQGQRTVEGYWPGEVRVVRGQGGNTATVDYYSKYFEKGYIYR
ncbi:MAG: hypothetical protein Q9184_001391 [Pyrenodesmia sp. 2 TL-2023]